MDNLNKMSDRNHYFRCTKCNYFFRIKHFQFKMMDKAKTPLKCLSCGSGFVSKTLKVEWAKNKGLMNKQIKQERIERGLDYNE